MTAVLVLLAGGSGQRVGSTINKVYLPLGGRPVLAWSLRAAAAVEEIAECVVVVREGDQQMALEACATEPDVRTELVVGGPTRHASEWAALTHLAEPIRAGHIDLVIIHDAARPLAPSSLFRQVIAAAREHGGAVPGRRVDAAIRTSGNAVEVDDKPSAELITVQTPQAFRAAPLRQAYERAMSEGFEGTDTAATVERYSDLEVVYVTGPPTNIKITFSGDLATAERLLG